MLNALNHFKARRLTATLLAILCLGMTASATDINELQQGKKDDEENLAGLEQERQQNAEDISELQKQIDSLVDNIHEQEEYQSVLEQKIVLQEDNLNIIKEQISELEGTIADAELNIANLELAIDDKEANVEKGMEEFKLRLRAMYINGNDSVASVLVGSSDFYDMLAKMEIVNRIATHDKELLDSLTSQIASLNESKTALESDKILLDESLSSLNITRDEYQKTYDDLSADYENTDYVINLLAASREDYLSSVERLEVKQEDIDKMIDNLEADIEKKADEIRKQQEELRRKQEEAARKNQGTTTYTPTYNYVYSGDDFLWPVPNYYYISSGFGSRWGSFHGGVDIAGTSIYNKPIVATSDGVVILASQTCTHNYGGYCSCGQTYGNYVIIDHGEDDSGTNYKTLYGHMTSVYVTAGQVVSAGDVIGTVGSTGYSTGYHLHYEIRVNNSRVNPMNYYS